MHLCVNLLQVTIIVSTLLKNIKNTNVNINFNLYPVRNSLLQRDYKSILFSQPTFNSTTFQLLVNIESSSMFLYTRLD